MTKQDDDRASRPDVENPEWTPANIQDARPALDVFEELFGPAAAETVKRRRGRPVKADRKVNQTLRLDADVLDAYRRNGRGWQTLMNQVLREHMPA
jgi:uncharacterized protein (DUF4415 family)